MAQAGISGYFRAWCAKAYRADEIIRFDISLAV